jgi:hypothetical protein
MFRRTTFDNIDQFGIAFAPGGLGVIDLLEALPQRSIAGCLFLPAHAPVVDVYGPSGVMKNVVLDDRVASAAQPYHAVRDPVEHISVYMKTADLVVEVNDERARQGLDRRGIDEHASLFVDPVEPVPVDIVEGVVADDIAAGGEVAAAVECPAVAGNQHGMMHLVVFDDMIVAREPHGHMGGIVDQVVADNVAGTGHLHARRVRVNEPADVMDMIVFGPMPGRHKLFSVPSCQADSGAAHLVDIVAQHTVSGTARDRNPVLKGIADRASADGVFFAAADDDRGPAAGFDGQSPDGDA